ncbi:MAG: hypothetical protein OXC95_05355 [Dehalococcoidia bacterium]|nr:hypothetical protein [Dehalococcoidia bacterium]
MTTQTQEKTASPVRSLDRRVESVESMRTGMRLGLGYGADAYLARSVFDGEVNSGDQIVGSYVIDEREGERFARITAVLQVVPGQAGQSRTTGETPEQMETMTSDVTVKNIQQAGSGYLVWSKNRNHKKPVFVPYHRLGGINIFKLASARISFYRNASGRLVASGIEVTQLK